MKIILFALFCFFATNAESQIHRFIYDVAYKKDSTQNNTTKENYHLDIGAKETQYYTRDFFIADSLINNRLPFPKGGKLNTSNIIVHTTGTDNFEEYDIMESTVLKLQTKDSQKWSLSEEKKVIKGIHLQKATTNWGGRNWIAWFTTDILFQEGPYKFHGLPGLIVELYDDKNNYRFELVKSQKMNEPYHNQFIQMSREMSVAVNWEKYQSTKLTYFESPVSFLRNMNGGLKSSDDFYLNDGTVVKQSNSREINERLRNAIIRYNNPIELNRAIHYPL
ncbi:hypothetical protein CHRYSEOSP005_08230 [Chryseobacterium sp. Alg-005]|uniref:GLPGLI family protein n=1 Tax=Chryseobacterium sp. Alg-005 TaxID=3159516 RepID=UPI003555BD35